MPGTDIFISYARTDRAVAKHFAQCFEAEGLSVWWDAALHSGETFDEVIERNLRAARTVVVLWSPSSVRSRWVRAEATLADRLGKMAPIMIEECELPIIFQLTHTTDLSGWSGETDDPAWCRFVDDLKQAAARGHGIAFAGSESGAPVRRRFDPAASAARLEAADDRASQGSCAVLEQERDHSARARVERDPLGGMAADFHALELRVGGRIEKRFVVTGAGLRIGRTAPSDIILAEPVVSRAHCLVELADDRLRVTDLRSTNGTFVDGKRIKGASFLAVGSVLKIGNVELVHAKRSGNEG
ncbi:hypothetical protein GCM10022280_15900 [Sphingomonas swuensis]|uniref:TIR domain-containing protein n=1 Tax=Sphingomonas swuensis TaxID=977800 RepID=A0ABP7SWK8_9SPHN